MSALLNPKTLHEETGVIVTGVDVELGQPVDWSYLVRPAMAHLVLNLDGDGIVLGLRIRLSIVAGTASLLRPDSGELVHASRLPGAKRHRFVVLSAAPAWLQSHFGEAMPALHPILHQETGSNLEQIGQLRSMSLAERDLCEALLQPPVTRVLRPAWFRGKALECFATFGAAIRPGGGGNDPLRQRIDAATVWLRDHFNEDLDLHAVARHVGCAPHYLSRLFKQHTGKTLSRKLRQIRIDRAAALLRDGGNNVTEAAFEVGYNSLSHFTKAFVAEKGVRPSDWRAK
jgi:AraC-like DNA-binding protein